MATNIYPLIPKKVMANLELEAATRKNEVTSILRKPIPEKIEKKAGAVIKRFLSRVSQGEWHDRDYALAQTFGALPHAVYLINIPEVRYEYMNPAMSRLLGYSTDLFMEVGLEALLLLIHPDDIAPAALLSAAHFSPANAQRPPLYYLSCRLQQRDGLWKRIHFVSVMVDYDPSGQPLRSLTVAMEQKKIEIPGVASLQASSLEDHPIFVCRYLPDGTLTYANNAYLQNHHLKTTEVAGHPFCPKIHEEDIQTTQKELAKLTQEHPVITLSHRTIDSLGHEHHQEWTHLGCFQTNGRLAFTTAWGHDTIPTIGASQSRSSFFAAATKALDSTSNILNASLSKSKKASPKKRLTPLPTIQALSSSEPLTKESPQYRMMTSLSHDVRTPLHSLLAFADLLGQSGLSESQLELVKSLRASGDAILNLVNDFLDFSKLEAGKMRIENTPFNIHKSVENLQRVLSAQAKIKGIRLDTKIDFSVPVWCSGDRARLEQVLYNLVGNAIKFTGEGGVLISVEAEPSDEPDKVRIWFEIIDSGIGITPAKLENLFRPYSQGDKQTGKNFGGTGLGLTIARELIELMGGSIGVNSADNKGTTVLFSILANYLTVTPAVATPPSAPARPVAVTVPPLDQKSSP